MLSVASFSPLFVAVLICWVFSVCIHEFAHALVAYLCGDTSVRERGYLRFNIFAYIHPVTSILLPVLFLALGGIALPGGAVYIQIESLRRPYLASLVSAAGPASNFILFLVLAAVVHPSTGIVDPMNFAPPMWVMLLGAMTVLQLFAVLFNLLPIPPLDGFGIIEPFLPAEVREKARALGWGGLFVIFLLFSLGSISNGFQQAVSAILNGFGLPFESTARFYNVAMFGSSP